MKRHIIPLCMLLSVLSACDKQSSVDKAAGRMLGDARFALRYQHYDEARDTIYSMRKRFPTALDARRQGILLLDSIELTAARDSLQHAEGEEWERLHVKVQFYERKLTEDLKKNEE
ncbi:MAG: hypothetical protein K5945_06185 [Bacteroidaceae bacterium]|nr:hypothetical protein [Bacteroidaceae bacterium]